MSDPVHYEFDPVEITGDQPSSAATELYSAPAEEAPPIDDHRPIYRRTEVFEIVVHGEREKPATDTVIREAVLEPHESAIDDVLRRYVTVPHDTAVAYLAPTEIVPKAMSSAPPETMPPAVTTATPTVETPVPPAPRLRGAGVQSSPLADEKRVYTSDPKMARAIFTISNNEFEQAWDITTRTLLPVGAPGGTFLSIFDPRLTGRMPDLIIAGGWRGRKVYRNYFIKPELQYIDTEGRHHVMPAQIHELAVTSTQPDLKDMIGLLGDATLLYGLGEKIASRVALKFISMEAKAGASALRASESLAAKAVLTGTAEALEPAVAEAAVRVQITERAEAIVAQANMEVDQAVRTQNRAYFERLNMKDSQIRKVLDPSHQLFKAEYGNAMERATARGFAQDSLLSDSVRHIGSQGGHVAGTGKPDFVIDASVWGHQQFMDVTTQGARAAHILRDYGKRVLQLVYNIGVFPKN